MIRSFSTLLGSVATLCLFSPALADEARYYTSQSAACDGRSHVLELRVAPDDEPNVRLFWRDVDSRTSGRDWHLPPQYLGGEPVLLDQVATYPKASLQAQGESGARTLTGTLTAAEAPGVWRLTEITLEPGPLRADLDPNAPATLDLCLGTPDRCVDNHR